jgi:hypothetical protein
MSQNSYTNEAFNSDLQELTEMINKYNADGGRKKSKRSASKSPKRRSPSKSPKRRSSKRHSGGAPRKRRLDADGNNLRSFRVVKVNGKDVSSDKKWLQRFYKGTAKNNNPLKAAHHAFSRMCKNLGEKNKKTCGKMTFTLLETSKGGDKFGKEFGPYVGKHVPLVEPRYIVRKDKKTGKTTKVKIMFLPKVHELKSNK